MPMLKLVLMSPIERLHIRNVLMVGGSLVLGIPMVLLIIFNLYEFVIKGNQEIDHNLEDLSEKIEGSFVREIYTMVNLLNELDFKLFQRILIYQIPPSLRILMCPGTMNSTISFGLRRTETHLTIFRERF